MKTLHIIRIPPIKKLIFNISFKSNQPSNDPTMGWKKKNNEPMLASINSNPLFQRKKAPAVETTPKYTTPNITYVFIVSIEVDCSSHIIKGVMKKSEKNMAYVVITKDENRAEAIFT